MIINVNNLKIHIDNTRPQLDKDVINEVIKSDCYELYKLSKYITPKVILDIGGHIGTFGILAKSIWPDAKLIALEPCKRNFELYRKNIKSNKLTNSIVIFKGLSYSTDKQYLINSFDATGGGMLRNLKAAQHIEKNGKYYIESVVEVITIEEILKEHNIDRVDLIKWDCEGAEIDAFENMNPKTFNRFEYMLGEYHVISGDIDTFKKLIYKKFPNHIHLLKGEKKFPLGRFWSFPKDNEKYPIFKGVE